jgi:outer membrane biosynthesis protein TonB
LAFASIGLAQHSEMEPASSSDAVADGPRTSMLAEPALAATLAEEEDIDAPSAPTSAAEEGLDPLVEEAIEHGLAVAGGLKRASVESRVLAKMDKIAACYRKQVRKDPELEGRLVIQWLVNEDGDVKNCTVPHDTMNNRALERCIMSKIKVINFPKPKGDEGAQVAFSFLFKPQL